MAINIKKKFAGILLSGGMSRRYGSPKAFALHQQEYFYETLLKLLTPYVADFVIVSHPSLTEKFKLKYDQHVIEDLAPYEGNGPLAGIYSGMNALTADAYIILPCDMPFLKASTIEWLVEQLELGEEYDGVIPEVSGRLQPLVTILKPSALPTIGNLLADNQLRLMGLMEQLSIKIVDASNLPEATLQFRNINTPEEYFC